MINKIIIISIFVFFLNLLYYIFLNKKINLNYEVNNIFINFLFFRHSYYFIKFKDIIMKNAIFNLLKDISKSI
jgi:hypothetical protein